ncbi:HEAT repeat domain-containing protein [Nocardiopsis sp. NPDC050513]|uniref:HEAT repeat domain-containing protein n=1 Tax=Nocardiopsis sp. NPDC050513 TaxID=3364338 RepID=UPI00379E4A67
MLTAPDILRTTDWDQTFHAYGSAADAPEGLSALLREDPDALSTGMYYFHSAILHQGSVYPATPPGTLFVAALLDDLVRGRWVPAGGDDAERWRVALLDTLREVAESAATDESDAELAELAELPEAERREILAAMRADDDEVWEDPALEAMTWQALADLRAAAPALLEAARPLLAHGDSATRLRAVEAASAIARLGRLDVDLSGSVASARGRDETAAVVLALGELGHDTSEYLTHHDPAIRACAALAPARSGDPAATRELVAALADPEEPERWFTTDLACFRGRYTLVSTLADRSEPADAGRLLPVFRALAAHAFLHSAEIDCGPLLRLAFPRREDGGARTGGLSDVQRAYLAALVANDGLWPGTFSSVSLLLGGLDLPTDREALRALAEG